MTIDLAILQFTRNFVESFFSLLVKINIWPFLC